MSLISRIRDAFTREAPRVLRNKPNGMAWIRGIKDCGGPEQLNGRAVKTLRIGDHGNWVVEPPQEFTATRNTHWLAQDIVTAKGERWAIKGLADEYLEPWRDDGVTDKEVADLYAPKRTKEPV